MVVSNNPFDGYVDTTDHQTVASHFLNTATPVNPFVTTQRGSHYHPSNVSSSASTEYDISSIQASLVAQVQQLNGLINRLPEHLRTPINLNPQTQPRQTDVDLLGLEHLRLSARPAPPSTTTADIRPSPLVQSSMPMGVGVSRSATVNNVGTTNPGQAPYLFCPMTPTYTKGPDEQEEDELPDVDIPFRHVHSKSMDSESVSHITSPLAGCN